MIDQEKGEITEAELVVHSQFKKLFNVAPEVKSIVWAQSTQTQDDPDDLILNELLFSNSVNAKGISLLSGEYNGDDKNTWCQTAGN
ncbi:MAG: hypothetical protein R8M45_03695 [Ghiorsea sp.]